MVPLKLNDFVAEVMSTRYIGSAFVLPTKEQNKSKSEKITDLWLMFQYTATRTAEEDWNDFGLVDHITSTVHPSMRQGGDIKGILLLKPGTWDLKPGTWSWI